MGGWHFFDKRSKKIVGTKSNLTHIKERKLQVELLSNGIKAKIGRLGAGLSYMARLPNMNSRSLFVDKKRRPIR